MTVDCSSPGCHVSGGSFVKKPVFVPKLVLAESRPHRVAREDAAESNVSFGECGWIEFPAPRLTGGLLSAVNPRPRKRPQFGTRGRDRCSQASGRSCCSPGCTRVAAATPAPGCAAPPPPIAATRLLGPLTPQRPSAAFACLRSVAVWASTALVSLTAASTALLVCLAATRSQQGPDGHDRQYAGRNGGGQAECVQPGDYTSRLRLANPPHEGVDRDILTGNNMMSRTARNCTGAPTDPAGGGSGHGDASGDLHANLPGRRGRSPGCGAAAARSSPRGRTTRCRGDPGPGRQRSERVRAGSTPELRQNSFRQSRSARSISSSPGTSTAWPVGSRTS